MSLIFEKHQFDLESVMVPEAKVIMVKKDKRFMLIPLNLKSELDKSEFAKKILSDMNQSAAICREEIHNIDLQKYKSFKDIHIGNKAGNKVDESLFYKKAMQHVNRMNNEKKAVLAKISKNFKLFLIIILAPFPPSTHFMGKRLFPFPL